MCFLTYCEGLPEKEFIQGSAGWQFGKSSTKKYIWLTERFEIFFGQWWKWKVFCRNNKRVLPLLEKLTYERKIGNQAILPYNCKLC